MEKEIIKESVDLPKAIAAMIRQSSEAGQLLGESEILHRMADHHSFSISEGDPGKAIENILRQSVDENEDLYELSSQAGARHYYSSRFMTQAYAGIMIQKQDDRLRLIAGIVRQNSEVYPRPVPLDIFKQPPFDLHDGEILDSLERMAMETEYGDIARTATSTSRVFLYSTLHLEPEYAATLAEWLDVGQFNNP